MEINKLAHGIAIHHIPIINKPFQDLAVITAATIKGFTDLPLLPVEVELIIAEELELAIFRDEINMQRVLEFNHKPLIQNLKLQRMTTCVFIKLLEKYNLYGELEYDLYSFYHIGAKDYINMLTWLHQHDYRIPEEAINLAIAYGHLNMVKWLLDNGYNIKASHIDLAIYHGRLELIKWLPDALAIAIKSNQLDTVKWLRQNGYTTLTK